MDITGKCKEFLENKLIECEAKLKKLKKKRKRIKILYITSVVTSVSLSVVIVSISPLAVPVYVITGLSGASGILTGISAKFNFLNKKEEISKLIDKLHKIQNKLSYVITLNGSLTKEEFNSILSGFE